LVDDGFLLTGLFVLLSPTCGVPQVETPDMPFG
jgi:hypothetical protein